VTVPSVEILKDEGLLEWRRERFAEFGFSAAESSQLAESEADWHLAAARAPRRKETPAHENARVQEGSPCEAPPPEPGAARPEAWERWK
jgi:hypothetical protein